MRYKDLNELLISEGCNPNTFSIGQSQHESICIVKKDSQWLVYYSERGRDQAPLYTSESEEAACDYFYTKVVQQQHWHIVGFFKNSEDADNLVQLLHSYAIRHIRNDIPAYKGKNDPRYRVFVIGKDIFKYTELFGTPQVNYA